MSTDKLKLINRILVIVVVLCITAIIAMLIAWPRQTKNNDLPEDVKTTDSSNIEADTEETVADTEDSTELSETIDYSEVLAIETPYCTVYYPALWSDYLKYEDTSENGIFSEAFYCCIKDRDIEMFRIYFGAPENGNVIGYIEKDGEKVSFSVDVKDFELDETWTEEETQLLYSMTEGVNDIIASVMANESYYEE